MSRHLGFRRPAGRCPSVLVAASHHAAASGSRYRASDVHVNRVGRVIYNAGGALLRPAPRLVSRTPSQPARLPVSRRSTI